MSWLAYIAAAELANEELERNLSDEVAAIDAFLAREESSLRSALLVLLLSWPFLGNGTIDSTQKALIRKIRRRADARIDLFERRVKARLVGRAGPVLDRGTEFSRVQRAAWRRAAFAARQGHMVRSLDLAQGLIGRLDRQAFGALLSAGREAGFGRAGFVSARGAARTAELTRRLGIAQRELSKLLLFRFGSGTIPTKEAEFWLFVDQNVSTLEEGRKRQLKRFFADFGETDSSEMLAAGLENIIGIVRRSARQFREQISDISSRHSTRRTIIETINGTNRSNSTFGQAGRASGIIMNRNTVRLAETAHSRGLFRSELLRYGDALGFRDSLLSLPSSRVRGLSTNGILRQQAFRIRGIPDWVERYRRQNLLRRSSGTASFGGFHHGDFSNLLPIPLWFLISAGVYSVTRRGQLDAALEQGAA